MNSITILGFEFLKKGCACHGYKTYRSPDKSMEVRVRESRRLYRLIVYGKIDTDWTDYQTMVEKLNNILSPNEVKEPVSA